MLMAAELERLKSIILHMASHIRDIVSKTSKLFKEIDMDSRRGIWEEIDSTSAMLDRIRKEFVNEVLVFMARRQPLGKELLISHTLISIAYDVYRISRYCREIARIDSVLAPQFSVANIRVVGDAFEEATRAVERALDDLVRLKPTNENIVVEIDGRVDKLYNTLLVDVSSRDSVDRMTALGILVMRHIERIVDHANYIERYLKDLE
uniref:Phosphate uptake regulator PhoU n=1 Tax=Ignisphaera aggregans TaxID=334771 RepID=A0A7J3I6T9_9CREN